jgi:hypothetical protein
MSGKQRWLFVSNNSLPQMFKIVKMKIEKISFSFAAQSPMIGVTIMMMAIIP